LRAVIQRVTHGKVSVDNRLIAEINLGLVILLGIGPGDDESKISFLTEKIAFLRIFEDAQGKMNQSLLDIHGAALVVSQFTLFADTSKGRRPSFTDAALPDIARPLVDNFVQQLIKLGVSTQQGEFGAHMLVEIDNNGPVTIILER